MAPVPPRLRPPRDYRLPVPEGSCDFQLTLGGVIVRVLGLPTPWDPFLTAQYAPFAQPPIPGQKADLTIRCLEGEGLVIPFPPKGEMTIQEIKKTGPSRFRIASHWQDGWIDTAEGTGELVLTDRAWDRFSASVENFLRVVFQLQVLARGMFLMHTSAIVDRGRCFLFFGPSGAGKSTATAFSLPRQALSDDMILVDTNSEKPLIHPVPFYMVFPPEQRLADPVPAAAALRLRQAPEDRLERLSPARAVATVSASVPFIHELGLPHEGLTGLVARFCAAVPAFDLYFTKSATFWTLIDELDLG